MTVWLVRAGRHGEDEQISLDEGLTIIGWRTFPDFGSVKTKKELERLYVEMEPTASKMQIAALVGQLNRFLFEIQKGDLVALPLKGQSAIAFGRVTGDYQFKEVLGQKRHTRTVDWLKTIPRSAFDQDLLYSLGSAMTICRIERNNAEKRIEELLRKDSYSEEVTLQSEEAEEETVEIETYARDQINKFIIRKFKGHGLARLVDAVLRGQGYTTLKSPPGPDGGIDILASGGSFGFDEPRICVQVKATSSPADVKVVRELRGVMAKVKAKQGLFVSWAGFTSSAQREARDEFFTIRLWDAGALLNEIFRLYDKLDEELKAELPLKRIWALVQEED